jgi:stage II sporulation protein P
LVDVHRDAAPASAYKTNVSGKSVTKIKLVVGRSNPKMAANLAFAKKLKAHIDKNHPGLSAGIFIGHGSYNQDLTSQAMLIEVGADKNTRENAEEGVRLLSSSIPEVLGVSQGTQAKSNGKSKSPTGQLTANETNSRPNYSTAIIIAVVVALGIGIFAFMNRGKVK